MAVDPRLALLESLLSSHKLTEPELAAFLKRGDVRENLHLEFKTGLKGADYDPPVVLREHVTAFANSDGGVLMVGVEDETKALTGCDVQGKEPIEDWAAHCLESVSAGLFPRPKISSVRCASGEVLVIAVARAPQLVPCVERSRMAYHLRLGDSTRQAPDYLIGDLMLGRRQAPRFAILSPVIGQIFDEKGGQPYPTFSAELEFLVLNEGLAWAEDFTVGLVCWAPGNGGPLLSPHLLSYLNDEAPKSSALTFAKLVHVPDFATLHDQAVLPLKPFARRSVRLAGRVSFPAPGLGLEVCFAVHITAKGAPPAWFQFTARPAANTWQIAVAPEARPVVTWRSAVQREG